MRRSRPRLLAAAAALGVAALAAALPASGADPGTPVPGQLHQAFVAKPFSGISAPPAATFQDFYLTGEATDQAAKMAGTPTATFAAEEPTGATIVQQANPVGNEGTPNDRLTVSWKGPFTGNLDGPVELKWFWSSNIPTFDFVAATVVVFGDNEEIGRTTVNIDVAAAPIENLHRVYVAGNVAETIQVQVSPNFVDTGHGMQVHYGSAEAPSMIRFPVGKVARPVKPQNVEAAYSGPPLVVQATPIGREAAEPTVGVDADGTAFMAAGAFDAVPGGGPLARTEIWRSVDGGKTWGSVQTKAPGDFTTLPPTTLDPYVYMDEVTGRVFSPDLYGGCNYMQWSDDKGETWDVSPIACGQPVNDHQTIVTGPPPEGGSQPTGYPNIVYYCFNRVADASCGKSLDGGVTWLPAGEPAFMGVDDAGELCGGLHGHIITDDFGRLYLPKGHCGFPWLAISEDEGATWQEYQVHDELRAAGTHLAVEVDAAGTIYYLWWDVWDRLPYLSHSKDLGQTWSKPVLVAPPGVKEVNFPTIDAEKPGQIAISFPGTTDDGSGGAARPWNYYVLTSLNADTDAPLFVSTTAQRPADPIHRGNCGPGRCGGMFDFIDVIFAPSGEIWAAATDTCTAEADCNTAEGKSAPGADGVAVRQLSGPGLSPAAPVRPDPVKPPAPKPQPPAPAPAPAPGPLPSTGLADWLLWAGFAGATGGLTARWALRRRTAA